MTTAGVDATNPMVAAHTGVVRVLFVTWDGPRSTYLQGLFLPIFAALRPLGFAFHVLQFTWADAGERAALGRVCRAAGVSYQSVTIWRRPVAFGGLATALWGRTIVRRAIKALGIQLLVPRSTLPAIATMLAAKNEATRLPILLDADGLPHDERVEFNGASPTGLAYRLLRDLEAWSVRRADAVMVRTSRAGRILADRAGTGVDEAHFHLVANARDERLFQPLKSSARALRRDQLGMRSEQPLLVYAGSSLTGKYRGDAMFRFFRHVRTARPDARLLLLMPDYGEVQALLALHPDLAPACEFRNCAPHEVPAWLGAADLGLALIHATFSMQAVAAIKLGEYLLCGVPVLSSWGVGDTEAVIAADVGWCLAEPDEASLAAAASWFTDRVLPDREGYRRRCRAAGLAHFSLETAVHGYEDALYAALAKASRV